MPVERKGFFFDHFEKIAVGVVALGLVLSLMYLAKRTGGERITQLTQRIGSARSRIQSQMKEAPEKEALTDYVATWRRESQPKAPGQVRDPFDRHIPVFHHDPDNPRRVGTEKSYVLDFGVPVTPDPEAKRPWVDKESPADGVIERVEHPAEGTYTKVRIYTEGRHLGKAWIVGMVGKTPHVWPIILDERFKERPLPPVAFEVEALREGIRLRFEPNPQNREDVVVVRYELFRKRARDVTGEFEMVKRIAVDERELTEEGKRVLQEFERGGAEGEDKEKERKPDRRGERMGFEPREGRPVGRPREEEGAEADEEGVVYEWVDVGEVLEDGTVRPLRPEETYTYKVRAVAYLASTPQSKFTERKRATTLPTTDFRFTGQRGNKLSFEVAVYEDGRARMAAFENAVGEEIGGTIKNERTGEPIPFETQCYLLEFHVKALRRQPYANGRIVYMDRLGKVRTRWRGESVAEDLFELAEKGEEEGPRERPGMEEPVEEGPPGPEGRPPRGWRGFEIENPE